MLREKCQEETGGGSNFEKVIGDSLTEEPASKPLTGDFWGVHPAVGMTNVETLPETSRQSGHAQGLPQSHLPNTQS